MIIITAGEKYTDIDAFACAIAYKEFLGLQNKEAHIVLPGALNHSVTNSLKNQLQDLFTTVVPTGEHNYVIVDVSEPDHIARFVDQLKIIKIFDHHFGFEKYWQDKLTIKDSIIEPIGACATLIWEEFVKEHKQQQISVVSAQVLAYAILSNTLYFNAQITDERDRIAYSELKQIANISDEDEKNYFIEQERFVFDNIKKTIAEDTKIQTIPGSIEPLVIGQLELWNGKEFINQNESIIKKTLLTFGNEWYMSVLSISEGKNYLYTQSENIKKLLAEAIGAVFEGYKGVTKKLWLRKETLRNIYELRK